jgi:hypothetical protein
LIQSASQSDPRLGFITVVETPEIGFSGGLLIVNALGRPVEFHCTAAVKVNRAQKILYGKTYNSFLFCDQIAASLIEHTRIQPQAYVTDCIDLMPLTESVESPVLLLAEKSDEVKERKDLSHFQLHERHMWFVNFEREQAEPMRGVCERFCLTLPLEEPLERIREAISEAQAVAR